MRRLATGVALGLILGWAAAHALSSSGGPLCPGDLRASLWLPSEEAEAVIAGAGYGFVCASYSRSPVYGGAAPPITRVPFFTVLGLVGAFVWTPPSLFGAALMPGRYQWGTVEG